MFDWMTQFDRFSLSPDNVPAAEKTQSELHKLFYSNADTLVFKWRHYLKIYEDHLSRFRNTPFHMLEIGVAQGGSLSLWRRYFGPEALLFGIDIDDRCRQFDKRDAHVRIGSQDDPAFLRSVVSEMGGVDVVLDDGSHMASHQLTSFQVLFPLLNVVAFTFAKTFTPPIHRHLTADIAGAGHSLKSPSKSSMTFTPIFMISRNPCLARIAPSTVSAFTTAWSLLKSACSRNLDTSKSDHDQAIVSIAFKGSGKEIGDGSVWPRNGHRQTCREPGKARLVGQ
jgi:hypothetical protein